MGKVHTGKALIPLYAALSLLNARAHAIDAEWAPLRGARIVSVSPAMRFNGAPLQVHEFVAPRPYRQALQEWRSWLGDRRVENEVRGWRVLARIEDRTMTMVRLKADGAGLTRGTISESPIESPSFSGSPPTSLVPPAGTKTGPHIEMEDLASHSRLQTFTNDHSVAVNVTHFRNALQDLGYRLERELDRPLGVPRGRSLWFSGAEGEAMLVAVEIPQAATGSGRTAVSLHFVRRGTRSH